MFVDAFRRNGVVWATGLAALALPCALAATADTLQRPTFRAETEAVWVTATVIDKDGRLITDLTKDDFEVRDNGIERDITVFRNDPVPFAVAILFDVSGSMLSNSYTMRQSVNELIAEFQPGDRATIGAFWGITEISPRFTANIKTLLGWVNATVGGVGIPCVGSVVSAGRGTVIAPWMGVGTRGAGTALWTAIQCGIDAVAKDAETPRRVVLVITDGMDNISILRPQDVEWYASQFGVMVYAIGMFGDQGIDDTPLRTLAENTGGGYFRLLDRDDLPRTFARVAEELRHQYVFGVSPAAGGRTHKLDVRVKRANAIARVRRVYLEAAPVATVPLATSPPESVESTPAPPTNTVSASHLDAIDRYARGDPAARPISYGSVKEFSSSFENLRKTASVWIRADPSQQARRRLAIAAYALDLITANPSVIADGPTMRVRRAEQGAGQPIPSADPSSRVGIDNLDSPSWESASDIVEWACELLRQGPPVPVERSWHLASIAALERFRGQAALDAHIEHAEQRFPKDPEWALARAVSQELRTWPERRDAADYRPPSGFAAARVEARFKEAAGFAATRQEAHLRWGYFELRRNRTEEALARFAEVGNPDDANLRYWRHLFTGRALERAGRLEDAIASYRRAFMEVPHAQSATTALGAALVANRRADEAAALTSRMLLVEPPLDPWQFYTFPATRYWQKLMMEIREAVKP